jgi:hypothetical protein
MDPDTRHHVHALVVKLPAVQLAALEGLLKSMLDPLSIKLALAPFDDEPFTEEDRLAVAEADEWSKTHPGTSFEDVVAELGFTMEQIRDDRLDEDQSPAA